MYLLTNHCEYESENHSSKLLTGAWSSDMLRLNATNSCHDLVSASGCQSEKHHDGTESCQSGKHHDGTESEQSAAEARASTKAAPCSFSSWTHCRQLQNTDDRRGRAQPMEPRLAARCLHPGQTQPSGKHLKPLNWWAAAACLHNSSLQQKSG
jgi:hypothetical protein